MRFVSTGNKQPQKNTKFECSILYLILCSIEIVLYSILYVYYIICSIFSTVSHHCVNLLLTHVYCYLQYRLLAYVCVLYTFFSVGIGFVTITAYCCVLLTLHYCTVVKVKMTVCFIFFLQREKLIKNILFATRSYLAYNFPEYTIKSKENPEADGFTRSEGFSRSLR